jgi:flotillin
MKEIVRPMLEKHLRVVFGSLTVQEFERDPEARAARVEAAASPDLGKMGLSVVSFTTR